jgi:hypothetical protein
MFKGAVGGNLLKRNRFDGTDVDARAAVAAGLGVNHGFAIFHGNGGKGAGFDAGFTSGAFFRVHNG